MSHKRFDERPGPVPDIRASGDSVIYVLDIPSEGAQLTIRCAPDGAIHVALTANPGSR